MKSVTWGELPRCIQDAIESHVWDNLNISEQRDWALAALAMEWDIRDVERGHRKAVVDAAEARGNDTYGL